MRDAYLIDTASDPIAFTLLDYFKNKGFSVYDNELAEGASLIIFDSSLTNIRKNIKEAKAQGILTPPYRITVRKVNPRNLVVVGSDEW